MSTLHQNSRSPKYPTTDGQEIHRFPVPDDKVSWQKDFPGYEPIFYVAPRHHDDCDGDIIVGSANIKFNELDGPVNRVSNIGNYVIASDGKPLNPNGRTGIVGRGRLPRWGPNHCADCIVTRWKRDSDGKQVFDWRSKKPVLQFVSICRVDLQVWAVPGGKVNPGESIDETFVREFHEEALDGFNPATNPELFGALKQFFSRGQTVYCGYVDDPRNTDNSWMETTARNFHDADGSIISRFSLKAGDDAGDLKWCDMSCDLKLFASHADFVRKVAELHGAHW